MASIDVRPVRSRREKKQFLSLPWKLYRDDPNWVPPLRQNQKEMTGVGRHPFYDQNDSERFLAFRDGEPVGRIVAIVNHAHNERFNEQRGFFGFFEAVDDQHVADALFDAARDWLKERGIEKLRGPANPSLNYEVGTLIDGFDSPPVFMMTYNPPYYSRLFEEYGLTKTQDLYAYVGYVEQLKSLDKKLIFVYEEVQRRFKIDVRQLDRKRFEEEVRTFLDIYNKSLVGTWGHVPLSDAEVRHGAKGLKYLIVPEMTGIAEVDGKPVGCCWGMLDYNPRIKQIDGRLFPFGFFRLLGSRKSIKTVRLMSTNVLPEYQRWGVAVCLLARLVEDVLDWGIERGEFSWVLESNHLSRKSLERGGAKRYKTYRLYDYGPAEQADEAPPDEPAGSER